MTEADILAMTYEDTCTVYRPFKDTLNTDETVFKKGLDGRKVYENIECALSSASGGKLQQAKPIAKTPCDYILFVRPKVDIQRNDTVVGTRLGKRVVTLAGLADCQPSHNNVPLKLDKETV